MTYCRMQREWSNRLIAVLVSLLLTLALISYGSLSYASEPDNNDGEKVYKIGFHLWKPGKIYDEAMQGIRDGLALANIKYEEVLLHSDRDKELARENLLKLDAMGLDLIYSLSSAGTRIAKTLKMRTPVIATVINHPTSLGVGHTVEDGATRLTGTSSYVDAKKQLELYRSLFPRIKKVGMIYDANNPAGALAEEPFMREISAEMGIQFVSVPVTDKEEIQPAAALLLADGVDAIVVPTNKLVYGNLDIVIEQVANKQIPIVAMNKQGVENGALAALFADTYKLGRQTAEMATLVLRRGANPENVNFGFIEDPDIIINLSSANRIGYIFPAEVLSDAAIVLQ